jgi:hypothetical protein
MSDCSTVVTEFARGFPTLARSRSCSDGAAGSVRRALELRVRKLGIRWGAEKIRTFLIQAVTAVPNLFFAGSFDASWTDGDSEAPLMIPQKSCGRGWPVVRAGS